MFEYIRNITYIFSKTNNLLHYSDVIMGAIASQITSLTIVYSTVYSGAGQRKPQSSAALAFVRGIHQRYYHTDTKQGQSHNMVQYTRCLSGRNKCIWYNYWSRNAINYAIRSDKGHNNRHHTTSHHINLPNNSNITICCFDLSLRQR